MEAASDDWEPNGWSPTLSSNGHAPSTSTVVRTNLSDTHASNHVFEYDENYDDSSDVPSLARAVDGENENLWLCRACDSADWRVSPGHGWTCMRCGNDTFYDAFTSTTFTTHAGSWKFVPNAPPSNAGSRRNHDDPDDASLQEAYAESETVTTDPSVDPVTLSPVNLSRRQRRALKRHNPGNPKVARGHNIPRVPKVPLDPKAHQVPKVYQDPKVSQDPKVCNSFTVPHHPTGFPKEPALTASPARELLNSKGGSGKGKGYGGTGSDASSKHAGWRDAMLRDLHSMTAKNAEEKPWSIRKGPAPGLKYRGGTPPAPPQWTYNKGDLQAFQRWERKLIVWRRQIASYLPPSEAAMMLYVSLKGEAEEELEHASLDRIDSENGVDYILETLRAPLMVKGIYLKRKFLDEFERLQRRHGESVKSFCNRYHRVERSLQSVGVDTSHMYDTEAAGSRLLDRLRLGIDAQRMILVATSQSLRYQDVKDAAEIQFPDHRPTPPVVYIRDFDRDDKPQQPRDSNKSNSNYRPPAQQGKGQQKGKPNQNSAFVKKTYVAETGETADDAKDDTQDDPAANDEPNENDEDAVEGLDDPEYQQAADDDEDGQDGDVFHELQEAANCLTVTARRLQGLTLGRKFTGGKTIKQRKQESHCSVCGEKGHWKGDPECSATADSKGNDNSRGKAYGKTSAGSSSQNKPPTKKVLHVQHGDGSRRSVTFEDECKDDTEKTYGTFFTYMVTHHIADTHQVFGNFNSKFTKVMVLDTACQKSCCSTAWLDGKKASLAEFKLRVRTTPNREPFEFGHGPTQYSHEHVQIPVCFDEVEKNMMLIGASVISTTNNIPFLASSDLMTNKLKMVLNLPCQEAFIGLLNTTVPICQIAGHLALDISKFPKMASSSQMWRQYHEMCLQPGHDPELLYFSAEGSSDQFDLRHRDSHEQGTTTSMAAELAKDGSPVSACRAVDGHYDGASSAAGPTTSKMDPTPRPVGHGTPRGPAEQSHQTMCSREDAPLWESKRKLRQVPDVREKVEVVRRRRSMDRPGILQAAATAIAFIFNSLELPGQSSTPSLDTDGNFFHATTTSGTTWSEGSDWLEVIGRNNVAGHSNTFDNCDKTAKRSQAKELRQEEINSNRGSGGGGELGVRMGTSRLKKGNQTWLTGHLRSTAKIYNFETKTYEALLTYAEKMATGPKIDLLEVFAGSANLTFRAPKFNLNALEPMDKTINVDLKTAEGRKFLWQVVKKFKPLLIHVAWPCRFWSLFNENMNYSHRLDELEELRNDERILVDLGSDLMHHQHQQGRLYLGENVQRSRIWVQPSVESVAELPGNLMTQCDAGAYGAEDSQGYPIVKTHRWTTNSPAIASELSMRMTPEQKMYAKPIEGAETEPSGHYCDGLVDAILRGLQKEARIRDPARFARANKVFYAHPSSDEQLWSPILDELERRFGNTSKRPYNIATSDPIYKDIENLIPWQLARVQVTWTPSVRRFPSEFAYTHRGAVLRLANGKILIEHEDLSQVVYPKQRYTDPIRLGIYFFGTASEDDDEEPPSPPEVPEADAQAQQRVPGITTDIWFEGAGATLNKELQKSLARLHTNMGHPPKEELTRILAASNTLSSRVLTGIECLRCGSCLRLTVPKKPPVSSTTAIAAGQFGDRIQSDIVYIRTLNDNNMVIGMVDEFTNYTVAHTLEDRSPATVLKMMQQLWYHPLGLPHHVTVDPDTAYLGECEEWPSTPWH